MTEARVIEIDLHYVSRMQEKAFEDARRFVAIRGGRRSGKTEGAVVRAMKTSMMKSGATVLWVDTNQNNLSRYVTDKFMPRMPTGLGVYKWREQKKILTFGNGSQIVFGSANSPSGLEGFAYDLIILNEAGIILKESPKMWESSILPMLMENPNSKAFFVGTPKYGAYQFQTFCERGRSEKPEDSEWAEYHWTSYDNPTLTPSMIKDVEESIEDKSLIPSEIYGEFTQEGGGYVVIPYDNVRGAVDRDVVRSPGIRPKWGVDVAGAGADRSTLCNRHANTVPNQVKVLEDGGDTQRLARMVADEYDETKPELKPSDIYVDGNGVGKGAYDAMRIMGLPVRIVMVQGQAWNKTRFLRLRDELWFMARDWFEEKTCSIPDDMPLIRELTTPMYNPNHARGLTKVESKREMKARGAPSPDIADSFVLTFAGGKDRPQAGVGIDSWKTSGGKKRRGSWLSA